MAGRIVYTLISILSSAKQGEVLTGTLKAKNVGDAPIPRSDIPGCACTDRVPGGIFKVWVKCGDWMPGEEITFDFAKPMNYTDCTFQDPIKMLDHDLTLYFTTSSNDGPYEKIVKLATPKGAITAMNWPSELAAGADIAGSFTVQNQGGAAGHFRGLIEFAAPTGKTYGVEFDLNPNASVAVTLPSGYAKMPSQDQSLACHVEWLSPSGWVRQDTKNH